MVGCLKCQDALEELQGQGQVGLHVLNGVERGTDAVGGSFVQVRRRLVLLLKGTGEGELCLFLCCRDLIQAVPTTPPQHTQRKKDGSWLCTLSFHKDFCVTSA